MVLVLTVLLKISVIIRTIRARKGLKMYFNTPF